MWQMCKSVCGLNLKRIVFLVFILIFSLSGLLWLQIAYASPYTSIDVNEAYDMITGGSYPDLVILDVRTQSEYDSVHIEGAVLIPHTELESRIDELDGHQNHEIIVYCGSGVRSVTASEILDAHGFAKVYNMLGGITAWMEADYPVISQYTSIDVNEAYDMITGGSYPDLVILDVRTPSSYAAEHIEDAINIPYYDDSDFGSRIFPALDGHEHHEIIVYCSGTACPKGPNACYYLANQGFTKVYEMSGGIYSWKSAGYPVTSPDTMLPNIVILSPENRTYTTTSVFLNFTVDEEVSWIGYSLDGEANVTIGGNTTLFGLSEGVHSIIVFANDTNGNMGLSNLVYFTVDSVSPNILILSPENTTYTTTSVPLTFVIDKATSWIGYSLNGQANETISGSTTLTGVLDGPHHIIVYANDTAGNMGASSTVYFTVDTTPPNITDVSQIPLENNVLPEDEVKVNATVTDDLSGVKRVTLNYTNGNGTWFTINMTNPEGNIWNATIPTFPYGTNVTYVILAEDNVGNTVTSVVCRRKYAMCVRRQG